jgi:hypothetical protein
MRNTYMLTAAASDAAGGSGPFDKPTPLATVYKKAREAGWTPPIEVQASAFAAPAREPRP